MCIRDSNSTLKIYYSKSNAYPDIATTDKVLSVNYYDEYPIGTVYLPTSIAVSYTHLDVYKRQILYSVRILITTPCW